ncbi:hypothetical protein [Chryseobacterium profundimaris]|uniref:Outer membrane lipoprotein carrier protein LolA n=1 Tax=Chryseobacterium profundimaris TaxID=1387275 RepID=A0ABY1NIT9_9FLAO|nr:hypothetical protein [Chryseobacterium profundimaris]SMP10138.1 hypothetical protein SAMN06264346_102170 [Chryseobacterium profundimaris]
MKLLYTASLTILLSASVFAQKTEKPGSKDKAAIEHFKNDYKKKNYKKFNGNIVVKDNQMLFEDKVIFYDKSDKITKAILQEGLIYPQLLTEFLVDKFENEDSDRTQKRFAKLQKNWKIAFDVNNIKLYNASELVFLSNDEKVKRFKILCKDPKFPNTMVYYIELTNKNAVKDMPVQDFIKDSKVTHIFQKTE